MAGLRDADNEQLHVDSVAGSSAPSGMVGRVYLERGQPVVVLTRWAGRGPRNVLIRRGDGSLVVRPFRGLRRSG